MECGTKKILIVEDNADLCDLLTITIRRLGHEAAIAITGEEAVERAFAMKPDLILMDIRLPKLNGFEATKQIKADPSTKDIPVVILSAFSKSSHGRRAIEAGAVEVLQKPVSVSDIEQVLNKYSCTGHEAQTESSSASVSARRSQETSNILH
jgi:two-component system, cell cycle response regulator DivK